MKKSISIYYLVFILLILFPVRIFAQERTLIRGTVHDGDKYPLMGATVIERDKENRTLSSAAADIDGNFSINVVNPNNQLIVRYVGYKDKTVVPGKNHVLSIILEDASTEIGEVVVIAKTKQSLGGLDIDQRDLSMAVSRISTDELQGVHAASIDDALQGRLSGVDIVGTTGNPGGGMSIRIRGLSSINGDNQPLIVVDNIPLESNVGASTAGFDFSTATEEEFSQMLNIPPSDIQDIVVLKDAAAAAIYGSRGANGVLLITTKRGTISPPVISLQSTFTLNKQRKNLPTLSGYEYVTMISEAMFNSGIVLDPTIYPEFAYDPNNPAYYYNYSSNTDWVDAITQTGFAQDYNLSLSGGSSKVRYRFSAGYWDETGTTIGTGYQRLNTRANLNYSVSDKLRFVADIAYTHSTKQQNLIPEGENYTKGDLRSKAYIKMPNQSIYYYNELGQKTDQYFTPYSNIQGRYPSVYNPVAMAYDSKNDVVADNILPKFSLIYDLNTQIQLSFDVAFEIANNKTQQYLPQTATGLDWNNASTNWASDRDDDSFVAQTITRAKWVPTFKNDIHRVIALAGLTTYDRRSNTFVDASSNLPSSELRDPSIPSRVYPTGTLSSSFSQQRNISAYANVNYTLLDRYIIYGSIRLDGDSRFGPGYRFGWFPALSGRYRISGEPFMKGLKWIDELSIRSSWGVNGKTPKYDYMYYSDYSNYAYNYMGYSATAPRSIALDELRWERSTQFDLGLNLEVLNRRIVIDADYYTKTTKDGIGSSALPTSSGFSSATMNLNTVENRGWEVNVSATPYKDKKWSVDFNFNFSRSQNYLRKLSDYFNTESGSWDVNGSYLIRLEVDQPYGSFYGYKYDGVYLNKEQTIAKDKNGNAIYTMGENGEMKPVYMRFNYPVKDYEFQAGDARYVDVNNDGNINLQDVVYLGDYNPLFFGGFGPNVKYKNVTLGAYFYFRYGNDVINMTRMTMESMYNLNNQSKATLKRFRTSFEPGTESQAPSDLLPRALYGQGYNWLGSDRFVEDGSFLRWKTLTLRYTFPQNVIRGLGLSSLSFWATMQNIYTWTNYTGQDPEVTTSGDVSKVGRDSSQAPRPYQYTLGFNVSF